MAKKPTGPAPDDLPLRADIPPEPADLFGTDTDPDPLARDAQEITEADLFDFDDPVTEPIRAIRAAAAPPADEDDILAWDVLEDASSTSFVGKRPDDSGSSILSGRGATASVPGSGWLDSGVPLTPPARGMGVDETHAFPIAAESVASSSGVNLHDPEGSGDGESESSIFGRGATDQSSRIEIPLPPPSDQATEAMDVVGPASIWDETDAVDADQLAALREEAATDAIDWDALKGLGAKVRHLRHADDAADDDAQHTLRAPRPELPDEPTGDADWDALKGLGARVRHLRHDDSVADDSNRTLHAPEPEPEAVVDDDFDAWLKEESGTVPQPAPRTIPDGTGVGLPIGATPTPAPPTPLRRAVAPVGPEYDLDEDDEPVKASPKRATAKPAGEKKAKSGAMAWIGGGIAGLLVGGGGVFGLSQMDMLPGQDTTGKPVVSNVPKGSPVDAEKLAELQKAAADAETARADAVTKMEAAEARAKDGEQAVTDLAAAKKAADKAGTDLIDVTKKLGESETKLIAVIKDGEKASIELNAAKDDLKTAMKDVVAAKDGLTAAMKDVTDAQKKAKANDDVLAGLVKEFKAAKLIDADADAATALAKLPDAAKSAATAAASGDAKKVAEALAAAKKELDASQASLKAATDDLAKAKTDAEKAMTLADDRAKAVADARKKAKASDDALAGLVKEFKAAKLIDADADAATALAELPDAAKKATAAAMSGDAAKAAEALLAAKKDLGTAQTALKKAETDLTAAKKDAKDAMALADEATEAANAKATKSIDDAKADATKAVKAAQTVADKLVAAAKKETDDKVKAAVLDAEKSLAALKQSADDAKKALAAADAAVKAAEASRVAEVKVAAEKAFAKEAEFARQLAAAKASATVGGPVLAVDAVAQEKAVAAYSAGVAHYFAGRYAAAEKELRAAAAGADDARYSYFLGLALLAQGQTDAAAQSFASGSAFERRNKPNVRDIGDALERIQGPARKELAKYRPM